MDILSLSSCLFFSSNSQSRTTDYLCLPVILSSVIPSLSGQNVSLHYDQYKNTPPFSPAKVRYPLAESDPFFNELRYPIVVSRPSQNIYAVLHS